MPISSCRATTAFTGRKTKARRPVCAAFAREIHERARLHPPFWRPDIHADRRPALLARGPYQGARCGAGSRRAASSRWSAPILQVSPGNEAHLHAFSTEAIDRRPAPRRSICTPRRSSPPRSCWRPASPDLRFRPRLPQPRAHGAAPSRVHHAGMVSGGQPYETLMVDCAELLAAGRTERPGRERTALPRLRGRSVHRRRSG
jgi:hypothetical protein